MHQSGEPGQALTGAALLRTTEVRRVAGSRSDVIHLRWKRCPPPWPNTFSSFLGDAGIAAGDDVLAEIEQQLLLTAGSEREQRGIRDFSDDGALAPYSLEDLDYPCRVLGRT